MIKIGGRLQCAFGDFKKAGPDHCDGVRSSEYLMYHRMIGKVFVPSSIESSIEHSRLRRTDSDLWG